MKESKDEKHEISRFTWPRGPWDLQCSAESGSTGWCLPQPSSGLLSIGPKPQTPCPMPQGPRGFLCCTDKAKTRLLPRLHRQTQIQPSFPAPYQRSTKRLTMRYCTVQTEPDWRDQQCDKIVALTNRKPSGINFFWVVIPQAPAREVGVSY